MNWLSDLKIGKKLYLGFTAVIAIVVVLVTVAYLNFSALSAANRMNVHTYEVLDDVYCQCDHAPIDLSCFPGKEAVDVARHSKIASGSYIAPNVDAGNRSAVLNLTSVASFPSANIKMNKNHNK